MKLRRIISGGQTGADYAGLCAAEALGLETGGTAPKGYRICLPDGSDGENPGLADFGLIEHFSREYPPRTKINVEVSDGTVWFGFAASPGGKLTIGHCLKAGKPCITNPNSEELRTWLEKNDIEVLNVAGNRAGNSNPDIFQKTFDTIYKAIKYKPLSVAKRGRGRPPKGFSEAMPVFRIRMSESVLSAICDRAAASGTTPSGWVRNVVIEQLKIEEVAEQESKNQSLTGAIENQNAEVAA